ncbi:hypothetical protein [Kluyvera ascorbata]|uniref:hypothetical protein n=1 Tax=Kluyvera ascorbata TaxID=51288 RepID=UPI0039F64EED
MSLRSERTKWVMFLPCSKAEVDFRHVVDLVFGVLCLEQAGINPDDIFIYIDSPARNYDSAFASASARAFQSHPTSNFFNDLKGNDYENIVIFVTGHGGPQGLDAPTPIPPNQLLMALKGTPNLKNAVVYLGQCYAGTFNFIGAGKGRDNEPDVILIGATNLSESLSTGTTETFITGEVFPWSANIFLLQIFKWMSAPTDVDGDGLFTVMDSYKHAGIFTNIVNKKIKNDGFGNIIDMHAECNALKALMTTPTGNQLVDLTNKLNLDAKKSQFENLLTIHHTQQECWILNSRPAQKIEF